MFFCNTMKMMSLSFVLSLSLISFVVLQRHRSLQPIAVFVLLLPSLLLLMLLSSSSSLRIFVFLSFLFHCLRFLCLMQHGKPPSACVSFFCLLPPSLFLLSSLWFLCFSVDTTARGLPLFNASLSFNKTAHNRCDECFANHLSTCSSTSDSMSWNLWYLREPPWHVLTTLWPLTDTYFESQFNELELRNVPYLVSFDIHHSLVMESFFCIHWSWYLYLPPSQLFPWHVRWSDVFVPLIIVVEIDESMSDKFGKTLDLGIFSRHQSLLSSPSATVQLHVQMNHHEILLLRLSHDSGLHELFWTHQLWFHLSHQSWTIFSRLAILSSSCLYLSQHPPLSFVHWVNSFPVLASRLSSWWHA